jgi:16S rRNA (guanine1207-N2)-methyltransferase
MTFQVRRDGGASMRFLSRPGVFSYGAFDDGARALVETAEIRAGDNILDIGCGCGTNGVIAGLRAGDGGNVVFMDSNLRAVQLAEMNARDNGLKSFQALASARVEGIPEGGFDVVLANPPYYAHGAIAQVFIDRGAAMLKPGGRFYLVTRQAEAVGDLVAARYGEADVAERRGYWVFCARRK